jgi:hypothetical protein
MFLNNIDFYIPAPFGQGEVLEFELRTLSLLGRYFTIWARPPAQLFFFCFYSKLTLFINLLTQF